MDSIQNVGNGLIAVDAIFLMTIVTGYCYRASTNERTKETKAMRSAIDYYKKNAAKFDAMM
jgi:hypothetical protein